MMMERIANSEWRMDGTEVPRHPLFAIGYPPFAR
jgi:hypothetical protein